MSDYSFVDTIESVEYVISRLLENSNLNDWEKKFIKNVKDYSDKGGFLSTNQKQKLSDLWEMY